MIWIKLSRKRYYTSCNTSQNIIIHLHGWNDGSFWCHDYQKIIRPSCNGKASEKGTVMLPSEQLWQLIFRRRWWCLGPNNTSVLLFVMSPAIQQPVTGKLQPVNQDSLATLIQLDPPRNKHFWLEHTICLLLILDPTIWQDNWNVGTDTLSGIGHFVRQRCDE